MVGKEIIFPGISFNYSLKPYSTLSSVFSGAIKFVILLLPLMMVIGLVSEGMTVRLLFLLTLEAIEMLSSKS